MTLMLLIILPEKSEDVLGVFGVLGVVTLYPLMSLIRLRSYNSLHKNKLYDKHIQIMKCTPDCQEAERKRR